MCKAIWLYGHSLSCLKMSILSLRWVVIWALVFAEFIERRQLVNVSASLTFMLGCLLMSEKLKLPREDDRNAFPGVYSTLCIKSSLNNNHITWYEQILEVKK